MAGTTERVAAHVAIWLAAATATFVPSISAAQYAPTSVAEQLFIEGRALMKSGSYALACEKFKASYALDLSAYGTLFNLALCHEQTGKPATAWAEFRAVAAASEGVRDDRAAAAREHEAKLRPDLSYVAVVVPAAARVSGLQVRIDQSPIDEPAWSTEVAIDPGAHVIEVAAPGKVTRTQTIVVGLRADHQRVEVAPLDDAPPAPVVDAEDRRRPAQWTIGLVLTGVGVGAVGVGLAFGRSASVQSDDANALCGPDGSCATRAAKDEASRRHESATFAGNVATVLVGAGTLFAVSGVVLVLTSRSAASPPRVSRLGAAPTRSGAGVAIEGTF